MRFSRSLGLVLLIFWYTMGASPKPNIILMVADDMGMGDTSAYQKFTGNSDKAQVHTPNMERLARMGVMFTDAHSASSRCTASRYGLLTGRYPWRTRLKHWVLFGSQGDPLIESDRPTIANLLKSNGYHTAIVGKWHVGLRYQKRDGTPAAGFTDADITKPLHTSPVDYGFDFVRMTSRSHPTSGPHTKALKKNHPNQNIGPGHIEGQISVSANEDGRALFKSGPNAYDLEDLGRRNSNNALAFIKQHSRGQIKAKQPFFLYYPVQANHTPYTPCHEIAGVKIKGASRNKAGVPMRIREDFIWENDVALGRLMNYLEKEEDPRNPGKMMIENTIIIFTSDNGAESTQKRATGPFRSNKGSSYEGGHRVPWIMTWKNRLPKNQSSDIPVIGTDFYATFSAIVGQELPNIRSSEKGGEDSLDILAGLSDPETFKKRSMYHNDHKESVKDSAVLALKVYSPTIKGQVFEGSWKIFFDSGLLRLGQAKPIELYDLSKDRLEKNNLIQNPELKSLVDYLVTRAEYERQLGSIRLEEKPSKKISWSFNKTKVKLDNSLRLRKEDVEISLNSSSKLTINSSGLGCIGGDNKAVDSDESLRISFDCDVVINSIELKAGEIGRCGGFYQMGSSSPLQIVCIDKDNDAKNQQAALSDLGVLRKGDNLILSSQSFLDTEPEGSWRLKRIQISAF